ncbi:hypothetical protein DAH66_12680 [Sphingomonas koreensis]|uniref:Uncharacterized protein n=1 Tax=Sphingomonas koreensis TaxID=93064 RepID=A0A430G2C0_9SPHN|nr:hypothetical protein [Sphingomonas koreensis]RSY83118.1 hypothetical protein DAH66_12680 [Sphingomonas koreensis]
MAVSRLSIWNAALDEVPTDRVDALDEVSLQAEKCEAHYGPARQYLLEDHPYDFAIVRAPLAVATNDRASEWRFSYALPSDMASPRHLLPYGAAEAGAALYSWVGKARSLETRAPLRIAGNRLYANIEAATLEYVTSSPSEARFTAMFARALAMELATRIVMPLLKDRKRKGELMVEARIERERAKAADMNRDRESTRDFIPEEMLARAGYRV